MGANHQLLLVAGMLLGVLQLVFPKAIVRFSAALRGAFGRTISEEEMREGAHAFRIIGALTLAFFLFLALRSVFWA
jgi:hypothetical protein